MRIVSNRCVTGTGPDPAVASSSTIEEGMVSGMAGT